MAVGFAGSKVAAFAAAILAAQIAAGGARLITVGGTNGWSPNMNYTEWSSQQQFYVGDWLKFVFNKYQYDVLEVNETSYQSCNSQGFISNVTRGAGRDVFELTEPKTYYFLCSKGYCWGGMKVAITVLETPAPAPSPAKKNLASSLSEYLLAKNVLVVLVVSFLLVCFGNSK